MKNLKPLFVFVFFLVSQHINAGIPANDAGITTILPPNWNYCSVAIPVKVILNNFGSQDIDSVAIGWSINNKVQKAFKWNGNLKMDSSTIITIGQYQFTKGKYSIKAWTSKPNGDNDSFPLNDTASILALMGPSAGGNDTICYGSAIKLGSNFLSGDTCRWRSDRGGFFSTEKQPIVSPTRTTVYYLKDSNTISHCIQYDTAKISLFPTKPYASFGISSLTQCLKGNNFRFTNTTVIRSTVDFQIINTESIVQWLWDFGDGTRSSIQSPAHSYQKAGTYIISLKVLGKYGCSDSLKRTIHVYPSPVAEIKGQDAVCKGSSERYASIQDTGISYFWNVTGGTIIDGAGTNSIAIYWPGSQTGTIDLYETNNSGCMSTAGEMLVKILKPVIGGISSNACLGQPYRFYDQSTAPDKFLWRFGDGDTSVLKNPSHIYHALGNYRVLLKVTGLLGCADSISQTVKVNPLPDAHWNVYSQKTADIVFKARDTTQVSAAYDWNFGDSSKGWGYLITHKYLKNKPYKVKLLLTDGNGCINTYDSTIGVKLSGISDQNPENMHLLIYPNPMQNIAMLTYSLQRNTKIKVSLTDISGKEIAVLADENQLIGDHQIEINAEKNPLNPGIYLIKLAADDACYTMRFVKL
jgi:PKD repeat protein